MSGPYLCITRNEIIISKTELKCSVSQFLHSYLCERFIYIQDRSAYSAAGKYVDQSWEYINCSQTHEFGNWDRGCAIPRKGIQKWDFPCSEYCINLFVFKDAGCMASNLALRHSFHQCRKEKGQRTRNWENNWEGNWEGKTSETNII